jgi:hypothetical protein
MAHKKKRRTAKEMSIIPERSFPLVDHLSQDIAIGMYDRVYVLSMYNDWTCYNSSEPQNKPRVVVCKPKNEHRQLSITIGTGEGIDKETQNEVLKVPELYAFPPGVLPICLVYVGTDIIYIVYRTFGTCVYDQDGELTQRFPIADSCAVDKKGGVILMTTSRVVSYTPKGEIKQEWKETDEAVHRKMSIWSINGFICTESIYYQPQAMGSNTRVVQTYDSKGLLVYRLYPGQYTCDSFFQCVFKNGMLLSIPRTWTGDDIHELHHYTVDGIRLNTWNIGSGSSFDRMVSNADGSAVYALDKKQRMIHVLVL